MANDIDWMASFSQRIDATERPGASSKFLPQDGFQFGKVIGFTDEDYYSLSGDGPTLTGGGVVLLAFTRESSDNAITELTFSRQTIDTRGWGLNLRDGTPGRSFARAHTTVPASVSEQNTFPAMTVGEIQRLVMVVDTDDNLLETYLNGTIQSAGAALASFAPPTAEDLLIGQKVTGPDATDDWSLVAFGVGDSVMTAAEVAAWDASIVGGNGWQATTGELTYLIEGKDAGGTSWSPTRGTGTLSRQGTVTKLNISVPVWAS